MAGFALISGVLGPRIINGFILYTYDFAIYGSLGKGLLFGLLAFGILTYKRLGTVAVLPWRLQNTWWLVVAGGMFIGAWLGVGGLLKGGHAWWLPLLSHVSLLGCVACLLVACFGVSTLRLIAKKFGRELVMSGAIALGFMLFLYIVYGLWPVLSSVVMYDVHWLLALGGLHSVVVLPRSLIFDKFAIEIAQYCSGIESIALFTGLYAVVGLVDRDKLNFKRFAAAFVPALVLLFACNILRVYGLILAGYYINQQLAFSLFHTYAGMIFFIVYSAIFWRLSYHWMLVKRAPSRP